MAQQPYPDHLEEGVHATDVVAGANWDLALPSDRLCTTLILIYEDLVLLLVTDQPRPLNADSLWHTSLQEVRD